MCLFMDWTAEQKLTVILRVAVTQECGSGLFQEERELHIVIVICQEAVLTEIEENLSFPPVRVSQSQGCCLPWMKEQSSGRKQW